MHFQPRFPALALAAFLSLAGTALAETITVSDISVTGPDGLTITIPTIEATDANIDEAGIRALFTDYAGTVTSLQTLTAASISIPRIVVSYDVPGADGTPERAEIVYEDFAVIDVVEGVANGGITLGGIAIEGPGEATFSIGAMSASYLDISGIIGFYGLGGAPGTSDVMAPIYKDFTMAGMTFGEGTRFACVIGPASAAGFFARPLKHSFTELMTMGQEMEAAEKAGTEPAPEAIAKALAIYADILTAFESTPSTLDGMNCSGADEKGRTVAVDAGVFSIGGFKPGLYPTFSLDDLRIEVADDGWLQFGNFTWKEMDLNGPIAAIVEAGASISPAWLEANWRKLVPAIEGLSVEDFGVDVPDEGNPGKRVVASIGGFDVTLRDYVNGVPSNISTSGIDIAIAVPDDNDGAALRALGIETLNLGFDLKAHWNEADGTITLANAAVMGTDLGAVALRGLIGNAGAELFSEDLEVARAAAMGLTVRELTLDFENAGVAQVLIAGAAAEQKVPPDAMLVQLAAMARALPIGLLGATQDAIGLGDALGSFLQGAPQLTVKLTAVDPNGIGLAEFMAAEQNPAVLQGKFTVEASASGEPVPFVFPEIAAPAETAPAPTPTEPAEPAQVPAAEGQPPAQEPRARDKLGAKQ